MNSYRLIVMTFGVVLACAASAQELYTIDGIEPQPVLAQALRIAEALDYLGSPLSDEDQQRLATLADEPRDAAAVAGVQAILDPYCLAMVHLNPEARVMALKGPGHAELQQGGWKNFLVKVHNEAGLKSALSVTSPQAEPVVHRSSGAPNPQEENLLTPGQVADRFLELQVYGGRPLNPTLSGFELEYAVVQAYTNERGPRDVELAFNAGKGTADVGLRNRLNYLFECVPSVKVVLRVADADGSPTVASFTIRDDVERLVFDPEKPFAADYRHTMAIRRPWEGNALEAKRLRGVYPLPSRRVAAKDEFPDFFFQPQVYRADGEHVYLPPGRFTVSYTRGPEYLPNERVITVPEGVTEHEESFKLERWIHLASMGWYSADHHVHAGGCSHYESPEAGVNPASMFRQALGEDLNVACVLTWGPCWYHQKTHFEGKINALSTASNLIRYDVEVSGFPSSHAGHIVLVRLTEDDYPGTTLIEEWPSWGLPVMKWGMSQNGVVGYAHSGWGLEPVEQTLDLPNYVMPKFDGIGANEYIVTAAHGACDFISTVDTPAPWELNIWYHVLNCGFRTRISGETDYPCIFDDRVGMGRSYAPMSGALEFDGYVEKIREGANYVSDGKSHILDFNANGVRMGEDESELRLDRPGTVRVAARVAAYLSAEPDEIGRVVGSRPPTAPPYWDIEKARVDGTREVPVEVIVNGYPAGELTLVADGELREVSFNVPIEHSSWVALRIYQSSHTNPIFVIVDDKPVRASKRSAAWCAAAVEKCWEMKQGAMKESERGEAKAAYDAARATYERILAETVVE